MSKLVVCKTCGNDDLTEVSEGILKCKYCRHLTERPKENADLMERAHNLRFEAKDFDEAAKVYDEVIHLTPDEAEAYWGKVLCKFGIEYVKDSNGEYLPTCHRTIRTSILEDADYLMAVKKASGELKDYYTEQAKLIDTYQTKIKVIAAKEEPYDVFISFKATEEDKSTGIKRDTEDKLIAQKLYFYLTKTIGLKVFFSEVTLKSKAGQEYEPIIYAALSSATAMVLVGTREEYINATWVKNEWSRYVAMAAEAEKQNKSKLIIPLIKGLKPEQLPSALASYQAVRIDDIGETAAVAKIGANIDSFIGDLRVVSKKGNSGGGYDANDMLVAEANNLSNLGFQQLKLNNVTKASEYFEKALEKNSNSALALWGKLLISQDVKSDEELAQKYIMLSEIPLCQLALEAANDEEKRRFNSVIFDCEEKIRKAEAKKRHNKEYQDEINKLKYNFHQAKHGKPFDPIDEKTDAILDDYIKKNEAYNKSNSTARKTENQKSMPGCCIVMFIIPAIIELIFLAKYTVGLIIGLCVLALGLFLTIHGYIKNSRLKSEIADTKSISNTDWDIYQKAKDKTAIHSAKLVSDINKRYKEQYPDEIDEYEPEYCIAMEILRLSTNDISEALGIPKADVAETKYSGIKHDVEIKCKACGKPIKVYSYGDPIFKCEKCGNIQAVSAEEVEKIYSANTEPVVVNTTITAENSTQSAPTSNTAPGHASTSSPAPAPAVPPAKPGTAHIYIEKAPYSAIVATVLQKELNMDWQKVNAAAVNAPVYIALNIPKDKAEATIKKIRKKTYDTCICELRYK